MSAIKNGKPASPPIEARATAPAVHAGTAPSALRARFETWLMRGPNLAGYGLISPTVLLMLVAFVAPVVVLFLLSFWTSYPFDPDPATTLQHYADFFGNPIYVNLLLKSIRISGIVTATTVILAYPAAYFIAFRVQSNKLMWLILVTIPFWTSYLLRVFAWKIVLGYNGLINSSLIGLGVIDQPLTFLLYNEWAVTITLAHAWAAFAILPIYVSLEKIDRSLLEAASDLGERPAMTFLRVTLPLSMPGVISAALLVFIPTVGEYVTPRLVGGTTGIMIGNIIQSMFGREANWPMGAAISFLSLLAITLIVCAFLWGTRWARKAVA
jgi:spermidine/putrescine transport system permease protein